MLREGAEAARDDALRAAAVASSVAARVDGELVYSRKERSMHIVLLENKIEDLTAAAVKRDEELVKAQRTAAELEATIKAEQLRVSRGSVNMGDGGGRR
jgi:hypothetical protein